MTSLPSGFTPLGPDDPAVVGPFSLVGRLGMDDTGAVYGALAPDGGRFTVKVVNPRAAADPDYREHLVQETEMLGRVDADCAPTLLWAEPTADPPWLGAPYIPGRTLAEHLAERGELTGDQLLAFAAGTAEALAAIHAAGISYRNVTPADVVLAAEGPRVLAFGVARTGGLPGTGKDEFGTAGWTPPELWSGAPGTPKSDVFGWAGWCSRPRAGAPSARVTPRPSWSGPGRGRPTWSACPCSSARCSTARCRRTRTSVPTPWRRSASPS